MQETSNGLMEIPYISPVALNDIIRIIVHFFIYVGMTFAVIRIYRNVNGWPRTYCGYKSRDN